MGKGGGAGGIVDPLQNFKWEKKVLKYLPPIFLILFFNFSAAVLLFLQAYTTVLLAAQVLLLRTGLVHVHHLGLHVMLLENSRNIIGPMLVYGQLILHVT